MKITLTSTTEIRKVNGITCRVWEGITANGIVVFALIHRVAVRDDKDASEFERDLMEQAPPSPDAVEFIRHLDGDGR